MKNRFLHQRTLRDLLIADLAIELGIADRQLVARLVLRRMLRDPATQKNPLTLVEELAIQARLDPQQVMELEALAEQAISEAEGSAQHNRADTSSVEESELGQGVGAGLRRLDPERFGDFELIGQGGMGVVYRARDREFERVVAFKFACPRTTVAFDALDNPLTIPPPAGEARLDFERAAIRFLREVRIMGKLEHPGIVPIHEVGQTPAGLPYFTMPYVRGSRTLQDDLNEIPPEDHFARLALLKPFLKVCEAVGYAHGRGIIHRDLKPSNVVRSEFGEVLICDWGLAKELGKRHVDDTVLEGPEDHDAPSTRAGTPGFIAPEVLVDESGDVRSDVFALSAMLYWILTGRPPFPSTSLPVYESALFHGEGPVDPVSLCGAAPARLARMCMSGLSIDPDARPQSADEIARAVRKWRALQLIEMEVARHLRDARTSLDAARRLEGHKALNQVEIARLSLREVYRQQPDHPLHAKFEEEAGHLLEREAKASARVARSRSIRRAVFTAVLTIAVGTAVAACLLARVRGEALEMRDADVTRSGR